MSGCGCQSLRGRGILGLDHCPHSFTSLPTEPTVPLDSFNRWGTSEKFGEWDECSKTGTSGPSDSDRESDYATGLEDLGDNSGKSAASKPTDILVFLSDPSQTSSFIQSILYEDSCAGVAVVDLFVAVKTVKEKMDFLAKCNNEVLCRITDLNRETVAIRAGYRNLMGKMLSFLDTVNDMIHQRKMAERLEPGDQPPRHSSQTAGNGSWRLFREKHASYNDKCHCCQERRSAEEEEGTRGPYACSQHRKDSEGREADCLACLLSNFGERAPGQPPILNEALLGSFIASLLWLRKGEGLCSPCLRSKIASRGQEEKSSGEKNVDLSESNIQMICDICEILCGTAPQGLGPRSLHSRPDACEEPNGSTWVTRKHSSTTQAANRRLRGQEQHAIRPRSRDSSRSKEETTSDGESIFEEALTEFVTPSLPFDLPKRHNVTCMGDLSNEMTRKKNVSTFTANSDMTSSWVGKLTDDIKAKLKKIKSKTNVTVVERPYEKSRRTLQKLAGALEFAITASTPVGVFDVTVLQYRKRRQSKELPVKFKRKVERPSRNRYVQNETSAVGGYDSFLEKDFDNSDSESGEETSDSGDDEMEEFLEIYVDNSKSKHPVATEQQKGSSLPELHNTTESPPHWPSATAKTAISMLPKSPFFEIQKRYPVFFVHEIWQKKPVLTQAESPRNRNSYSGQQIVPLNAGGRQQQEVVIRRSSSDLVIYIQVELEEGQRSSAGGLLVEYQTSSHGTQTREAGVSYGVGEEKVIKLEEELQNGESLYHIWRGYETGSLGEAEERERITFEEPMMIIGEQEAEIKEEDEERVVMVKEPTEKMVTFKEVLSETFTDGEIQERSHQDEGEQEEDEEEREDVSGRGSATVVALLNAKLHADIWLPQSESTVVQRMQMIFPKKVHSLEEMYMQAVAVSNAELEKALTLVREIESDVMDVKLSDAILILPQLESELRKHLHNKVKRIGETGPEKECSVENFFSAVDFWPDEEPSSIHSDSSEERLNNLLKLLSDLEEAVRSNEYSSSGLALCEYNSSKIYSLLHALTDSIRKLEETPTVMSLSQTLDIASQLDTAVREYDSVIKRQPLEYVSPEMQETRSRLRSRSAEDMLANRHLNGVRKKVFEIVEEEAIDMEGRIERDFDRLDRLERENDEALKFLEAFLQKTERRAAELNHLKTDLKELASSMNRMYDKMVRAIAEREKKLTEPSTDARPGGNEPVRETISGLLIALDNLKSKAREKNEVCREILSSVGFQQGTESEKSSRRSSRSSFTAKQVETMTSTVKDFKKIGRSSLYLSWTKPEGSPSVSVMGYEIHVNGTLNQKVRNPARLQAVLYSVDLKKKTEVHLYALVDSGPKILLASVAYLDV